MSSRNREIKEGRQYVGVNERPVFRLDVTKWGSSPTSIVVTAYDYNNDDGTFTDVSATVLSGAASVSGNIITLPTLIPAAIGKVYFITIKFTVGGLVLEAFAWVVVER